MAKSIDRIKELFGHIKIKNINKVCSSILVPLMIGLVTAAVATVQLHIAQKQREQDLTIADNSRRDAVLAAYIKEMSDLFISSNYSYLRSDQVLNSIFRAKSLTAFRQLDVKRKTYLIQFLYDSGALFAKPNPINLHGAVLDGIDLSTSNFLMHHLSSMQNIALKGISLISASFAQLHLVGADFSFSNLTRANFHLANLENTTFQTASLQFANFLGASCENVDFFGSDLRGSNIEEEQLQQAGSMHLALLPNGTMARNPSLFFNGNAESDDLCSTHQFLPIRQGSWIVRPQGSIGVTGNTSLIMEAYLKELTILEKSLENTAVFMRIYRMFLDIGKCSFVARGYDIASIFQYFHVPEQYRKDERKHSWVLTAFCGSLHTGESDVTFEGRLLELDDKNGTINDYKTEQLRNGPVLHRVFPYNKTVIRASFELQLQLSITAANETLRKDEPWAFCDNIYLSLERTPISDE